MIEENVLGGVDYIFGAHLIISKNETLRIENLERHYNGIVRLFSEYRPLPPK
jgi:hypothetical protein